MAPTLIGWVVFASDLDGEEMRSLERLSAIPLQAAVLAYGDKADGPRRQEACRRLRPKRRRLARNHVGRGAAFEMRVGGEAVDRARKAACRPSRTRSGRSCSSPILRHRRSADARKLQLALAAHDFARLDPRRHRDLEGGRPDHAAARAARRGRRQARIGRACPGQRSRHRRAGAARHELQRNVRQDRRARAAHHAARVQRRTHRPAQPHDVPAGARTSCSARRTRRAACSRFIASTSTSSR